MHEGRRPSDWVRRFVPLVPDGAPVLDLASGSGRHTRLLLASGHPVTAVDIDVSGLADLAGRPGAEILQADLERGDGPFSPGGPLAGRSFGGVVVTNYLHRPLLERLVAAVAPGGVLIYETFCEGNEALGAPARPREGDVPGRPSEGRRVTNPDFLLRHGELLDLARGRLRVVAYEDVVVPEPQPVAIQRICAVRPAA